MARATAALGTFTDLSGSIALSQFAADLFTADATGRAPFADGLINAAKSSIHEPTVSQVSGLTRYNFSTNAGILRAQMGLGTSWLVIGDFGSDLFAANATGRAPFADGIINAAKSSIHEPTVTQVSGLTRYNLATNAGILPAQIALGNGWTVGQLDTLQVSASSLRPWVYLGSAELGAAANAMNVNNIDSTYNHLRIRYSTRHNGGNANVGLILNQDANANYIRCADVKSSTVSTYAYNTSDTFLRMAEDQTGFTTTGIVHVYYADRSNRKYIDFSAPIILEGAAGVGWIGTGWWTNSVASVGDIQILGSGGHSLAAGSHMIVEGMKDGL